MSKNKKHKQKNTGSQNKKNLDLSLKIILASLVGLAILLFTVIVVTFAILNSNKKDAIETSERVVNQLQAKNVEGFAQLTSAGFNKEVSKDKVSSFLEKISPSAQGQEELIGSKIGSISNSSYAVSIYKVNSESQDIYIKTILVKEAGNWKLLSIQTSTDQPELKFRT